MSETLKDAIPMYIEFLQKEYNKTQNIWRDLLNMSISDRQDSYAILNSVIHDSIRIIETLRKIGGISEENWTKFIRAEGPCNLIF